MIFLNLIKEIKDDIQKNPLYLYGAGGMGLDFLSFANEHGVQVSGFIDSNPERIGGTHGGLPIVDINTAIKSQANIVITTTMHLEVRPLFQNYHKHVLHTKAAALIFSPDTPKLYQDLDDQDSKDTLASLFDYFRGHSNEPKHSNYPQYQNPATRFNQINIIIDAGAHVASAFKGLRDVCSAGMHAYLFEPIPENCMQIRAHLNESDNATIIEKGLWSQEDTLVFEENVAASRIRTDLTDGLKVPVIALDQMDLDIDMIKMDIEGAEQPALFGAKETIQRRQPNMAISIYHSFRDFVDIPKMLRDQLPGHKFYLGHHNDTSRTSEEFLEYETVFYALRP